MILKAFVLTTPQPRYQISTEIMSWYSILLDFSPCYPALPLDGAHVERNLETVEFKPNYNMSYMHVRMYNTCIYTTCMHIHAYIQKLNQNSLATSHICQSFVIG